MTPASRLTELLARHQRIAIAGVPRAGKTTLAGAVADRPVVHTDEFISGDWDNDPKRCAESVPRGPVVIEGVRALAVAKLLKEPVTCVVWRDTPRVELTPKQRSAAAGRRTNFAKWLAEYGDGVEVVRL